MQAIHSVWHTKLDPIAKLILLKLSDSWSGYPDEEGEVLAAAFANLSAFSGADVSEVRAACQTLNASGYLRIHAITDAGMICELPFRDQSFVGIQSGRQKLPVALRKQVLQRDGWRCKACGAEQNLQIDHVHPLSRGGGDEIENLQVLCGPCNLSKRDKTMDEWEGRQ